MTLWIIDCWSIERDMEGMWTLHRPGARRDLARLPGILAAIASVLLSACSDGTASTPDHGAGAGASPPSAGSPTGGAGNGGETASGGSGGSGNTDPNPGCAPREAFTLAVHVVVDVTWPDTLGADGGSGKMHAWSLARMSADGTSISGMTQPCGSDLPELTLKELVGGGKFDIEVPDAVWDAPSAPRAASVGTLTGWEVGSSLSTEASSLLVGLTMSDPDGPWPDSHTEIKTLDADGDDKPGFTGIPKSESGYVRPPLTPPLVGSGATADEIYMVSRTTMSMSGALSSCTEQSGTVTVTFFDNHIVGCHVAGGDDCSSEQVDFLDVNRNKLTATQGIFTSKLVPDTATCADARGL
jgi:hypothetical protein